MMTAQEIQYWIRETVTVEADAGGAVEPSVTDLHTPIGTSYWSARDAFQARRLELEERGWFTETLSGRSYTAVRGSTHRYISIENSLPGGYVDAAVQA